MRIALAAVGLLLLTVCPALAADTIRVAVLVDVPRVELRGADVEVVDVGGCDRCPRARRRLETIRAAAVPGGVELEGRRAAGFRLTSGQPIRSGSREYGGVLEIVRVAEGLALVNEVPFEDYVVGVVRAEVGDRWPAEALRAQAIVARTYGAYQRLLNSGKPYHVLASTAHQVFFGRVPATSPAWDAVRDTAGQVLLWEGQLFPAFYHTESGGVTEDPRTVFAARNMPALRPVVCPFSVDSPHHQWHLELRLAEVGDALRRHGLDIGKLVAVDVTERTPSLRAAFLAIRGSHGNALVRGHDLRRMLGYDVLKSTLFAVTVDDEVVRFAGRGYGHGVGLCQWGARGMAEQGYRAQQILEHYYPGATPGWLPSGAR